MKTYWQAIVLSIVPAGLVFAQAPARQNEQFTVPPLAQFGGQQPQQPDQPQAGAQQPGVQQPLPPGGVQPGQFGPQPGQFRGPGPQAFLGPPPNAMFSAIDVDGDGVITKAELRRAVMQLRKLDADKDGNITLAEVSMPAGPGGPWGDPAQFVQRVIADNDKNGDQALSLDEIPDQLKPILANADVDNDTIITRDELAAVAQNMNRFPGGPGAGPWNQPGAFPGQPGLGNRNGGNELTGQLMRQNDKDGDDKLSSRELPSNMRGMFKKGDDLDGDGALDAGELQAVIERMGDRARALRGGVDPEEMRNRRRSENRLNRNRAGEEQ